MIRKTKEEIRMYSAVKEWNMKEQFYFLRMKDGESR